MARADDSTTTQLLTLSGCKHIYVKLGKDRSIAEYFHDVFGAKIIVLDPTSDADRFRLRYLVVESDRYPGTFHFVVGREFRWVVQERLLLEPAMVRRWLDDIYERVKVPDSTAHDHECRVAVFVMKYFARMLDNMVESCDPSSPMTKDLYHWIQCFRQVSSAAYQRHARARVCKFDDHRHRVSRAVDRINDAIRKTGLKVLPTNPILPLVVYEDSDYFHTHDHQAMKW